MKKSEKWKVQFFVMAFCVLGLVAVLVGSSYAIFSDVSDQGDYNTVTTGTLQLSYEDTQSLSLSNLYPVSDVEGMTGEGYTFTVRNIGTLPSDYKVMIQDDEAMIQADGCSDHLMPKANIKISVDGGTPFLLSSIEESNYMITTGNLQPGDSVTHVVKVWIDEASGNEILGTHFHGKVVVEGIQGEFVYRDESGANPPELVDGMIPVTYNGTNWVKADTSSEWYDYTKQEWANAVTVTEGTRSNYMSSPAGTEISMDDINTMWVWIPRYSYTIKSEDGQNYYGEGESCETLSNPTFEKYPGCYNYVLDENEKNNLSNYIFEKFKSNFPEFTLEEAKQIVEESLTTGVILITIDDLTQSLPLVEMISYYNVENPESIIDHEMGLDTSKITTSIKSPGSIDIRFSKVDEKYTGKAQYTGNKGENYLTHPAFTFGEEELTGFWYAKFETAGTVSTSCTDTTCDTSQVTIKPGATSLRNQTISSFFYAARSMQLNNSNTFGFSSSSGDLHMSKNSEWGAVAYLSQSKYGKYGNSNYNGIDKEVVINNCDQFVTGVGGDTVSADSSSETCTTNTYETEKGQAASTTGNITGVYDMSGGSWEYVMGNYNNTLDESGFNKMPESKYYDLYTTEDASTACNSGICYGQALSETAGWYTDIAHFLNSGPWMLRSGLYSDYIGTGVFAFSNSINGSASSNNSSRFTVTP